MSSTSLLLYKKLDKNGNYFECVLNYKFTDHCSSKKIVQATIKTSPPLIVRVQTQYFKIVTKKISAHESCQLPSSCTISLQEPDF